MKAEIKKDIEFGVSWPKVILKAGSIVELKEATNLPQIPLKQYWVEIAAWMSPELFAYCDSPGIVINENDFDIIELISNKELGKLIKEHFNNKKNQQRLGQAIWNKFSKHFRKESWPELFYETDNKKVFELVFPYLGYNDDE